MTPPPAYDIHEGNLRVWVDGKAVAVFPRHYFRKLAERLYAELLDTPHDK